MRSASGSSITHRRAQVVETIRSEIESIGSRFLLSWLFHRMEAQPSVRSRSRCCTGA